MQTFLHDIRYALRMLRKNPGFTAIAIITLALGIGANTAMFSAVNAVLLRALPFRDPGRLVVIWETNPHVEGFIGQRLPVRLESFLRWKKDAQSFQDMAAYHTGISQGTSSNLAVNLTGIAKPQRVESATASSNFFRLLGVNAELGRTFAPEEGEPGRDRVVILSHSLYQRMFGEGANVLGRDLSLNEIDYRIIGVLPAGFHLPGMWQGLSQDKPEIWTPMNLAANQPKAVLQDNADIVLGRLKPGASLAQARSEMQMIEARLRQEKPEENQDFGTNVFTIYTENLADSLRRSLLVLQLVVGFVLLIACVNVANLLLTRAAGREKEIAIRVALGASRGRLVRQSMSESLLFSLLGGAAGLLLAWWGIRGVRALAPADILGLHQLNIDPYVLAFTAGVMLLAGMLFGLAPALHVGRQDIQHTISKGSRTGGTGISRRLRILLVVAEISLAVIPLAGAGLMVRTLRALLAQDPGFQPQHVLTAQLSLPALRYSSLEQQRTFCARLLQSLPAIPGVRSAALSSGLPMQNISLSGIHLEGEDAKTSNRTTDYQYVSERYFSTMGSPLLRGRGFTRQEAEQTAGLAIVNQALAQQLWPHQDPVGKVLYLDQNGSSTRKQVIGEVPNTHQLSLGAPERPEMYLPRRAYSDMSVVVLGSADPMALAPAVAQAVFSLDKNLPLFQVQPLSEVLRDSVSQPRFTMFLLIAFAGLALALSAIGLYGVLAYTVSRRTQEIGVRMALGAQAAGVLSMVLREGVVATAAGLGLGLAGALILARLMSTLLFGVKADDPLTFAAVALMIAAVAVLASYVPARRASRVDPMAALRYE
ncbi:MAG TPA: ABC transporter permease [Terriglobales bacterium]|nr:ABC transporter permease [Terriglobales bacterium]